MSVIAEPARPVGSAIAVHCSIGCEVLGPLFIAPGDPLCRVLVGLAVPARPLLQRQRLQHLQSELSRLSG